ncbi:glycosyltransferase [Lacrimispora sp. 210928-DFI.3.58]|uniref:glycosyltransferase n=1 Tax=Lacrimispora sp. 210928-DFI.3.58 TaxID=2883214 RepID=UPI001D098BB4|nr:glycosyltransferase [Lacrimispora sp. 210928-DFI.3.58]MCB7320083.1 glycosyltransferase [Lacrimispora sp. 210928-DFI.3.58]
MKICLVGSLLPTKIFDDIVRKSKYKPSNAPENFQLMLAKGLSEQMDYLTAISFPTMAPYPKGPELFLQEKKYTIGSDIEIVSAPMINIQGFKQRSISHHAYRYVRDWLRNTNDDKKIVISYSDYPPYADACRKACARDDKASCVLLMTDLPTFSLYEHKSNPYTWMMNRMDRDRIRNFDQFDAYILLTKYMQKEMRIENKPVVIVEGFSDPAAYDFDEKKNAKKTLMYAGALSTVHNIRTLVDAFLRTDIDAEFWIFGGGDQQEYVCEAASKDKRIRYFGKVSRNEMLHAQKRAHVLVSAKSTDDRHTNFAFPSKILEYMTSGTAVLTTRVGGIPEEYFDYVYTINDESIDGIAKSIEKTLNIPIEELTLIGNRAKTFVTEKKNYSEQAKRIVEFLNKL